MSVSFHVQIMQCQSMTAPIRSVSCQFVSFRYVQHQSQSCQTVHCRSVQRRSVSCQSVPCSAIPCRANPCSWLQQACRRRRLSPARRKTRRGRQCHCTNGRNGCGANSRVMAAACAGSRSRDSDSAHPAPPRLGLWSSSFRATLTLTI